MVHHPNGTIIYTIQPNDTLWLLSQRYDTTVNDILNANPGLDIKSLHIGQPIYLCPGQKEQFTPSVAKYSGISKEEVNLINHMRMLWEQQVQWTRFAIISIVFDLPDVNIVSNRLLRNPIDFQESLKPIYGNKNASIFATLLKSHLLISAQLVQGAKAGDSRTATNAEKRWYSNVAEIASFLESINPYWSQLAWKTALYKYLAMTKSEAVNILSKNYSGGIKDYDEIESQSLEMADMMSKGIIKQFLYKN